ncbi:MAG TPA: hypothetical protein VMU37_04250, partial [Caulobacteraceae bacterium]|nr:hypothetical protein [Caulobacteraceae bacterium]
MAPKTRPLSFNVSDPAPAAASTPPVEVGDAADRPGEDDLVFPASPPAPQISPAALAPALEPGAVLTRLGEQQVRRTGVYVVSGVASLVWACAVAAFAYLALPRGAISPLAIALLALLAIAPMGLILAGAYLVAQARI